MFVIVWRRLPSLQVLAFAVFWSLPFFAGSMLSGLETHLAACALLAGGGILGIAALLRPDTALLALAISGRRWWWVVMLGVVGFLLIGWWWAGSPLPNTIGAKFQSYGLAWGKGWGWWPPEAFGWLAVPIMGFGLWANWRLAVPGVAMIAGLWLLGIPGFWWYAVGPLGLCGFAALRLIDRPWKLGLAMAFLACGVPRQHERLMSRTEDEGRLADAGNYLASLRPRGTLLLEPAGIIPYILHDLKTVDHVGLVEPWMAKRRAQGPGWMTDAISRYEPEWMLFRHRDLADLGRAAIGPTAPFRSAAEGQEVLGHYVMRFVTHAKIRRGEKECVVTRSSSLVALERRRP